MQHVHLPELLDNHNNNVFVGFRNDPWFPTVQKKRTLRPYQVI